MAVVALSATAATAYVMIVALPDANQAFREIIAGVVKSQVENKIRPRVLFTQFPNTCSTSANVLTGDVVRDVFFADTSKPGTTTIYFAREGRVIVDRNEQAGAAAARARHPAPDARGRIRTTTRRTSSRARA